MRYPDIRRSKSLGATGVIALITRKEEGGFPLQGGHSALRHTTAALGDPCCILSAEFLTNIIPY